MKEFVLVINYWHWFCLAIILGILDVLLGASFALLVLAINALIMAGLLLLCPNIGWQLQILFFSIGSVISIIFWYINLRSKKIKLAEPILNKRTEQYLYKTFTLVEPIINGRGRIKVDDSFWIVTSTTDLPIGLKVKVIGVDGILLQVEELK